MNINNISDGPCITYDEKNHNAASSIKIQNHIKHSGLFLVTKYMYLQWGNFNLNLETVYSIQKIC